MELSIWLFTVFVAVGLAADLHTKLKSERNKTADLRKELETIKRETHLTLFDKNEIIAQQTQRIEELEDAVTSLTMELKRQEKNLTGLHLNNP